MGKVPLFVRCDARLAEAGPGGAVARAADVGCRLTGPPLLDSTRWWESPAAEFAKTDAPTLGTAPAMADGPRTTESKAPELARVVTPEPRKGTKAGPSRRGRRTGFSRDCGSRRAPRSGSATRMTLGSDAKAALNPGSWRIPIPACGSGTGAVYRASLEGCDEAC